MSDFTYSDGPSEAKNTIGLRKMSHNEDFLSESEKYLQDCHFDPEYGKNYYLSPKNEPYLSFLRFFIEELTILPFDDKVGKTYEMNVNAKEIISRFILFLEKMIRNK